MIEITDRWGLAKKGTWEFNEQKIQLPNIFFLESEYFVPPDDAEITISTDKDSTFNVPKSFFRTSIDFTFPAPFAYPEGIGDGLVETRGDHPKIQIIYDQEPDPDAELYVIGNAPELLQRSGLLYEKLVGLRERLSFHKLIYAPGITLPQNMALLAYLGVDLFDSSLSELMGLDNVALTDWMEFAGETEGNDQALSRELELIRKGIESGRIRELVESRVRTQPWMVEALRAADKDYQVFSEGVPVTGGTLNATTRESLNRPDIKRFIRRIKKRYEPPERDVLLLLPCSARKPYFLSNTHRRIRHATQQGDWTALQEVILTSPLGAVPRELEQFYPAQQYDIPVSDEWFQSEKELIIEQLKTIMDKRNYEKIISHLPKNMSFVADDIDCVNTTKGAHPTSEEALERLAQAVKRYAGDDLGSVPNYLKENMSSFAIFQFGEDGKALLEGTEVKGRYPRYKIIDGDEQRGMLVPERGLISLTLEGAQRLKEKNVYQAQIDDFKPKGSVFAVGVREADHKIRPEDEVLVLHEDELRGVGPATMSGREMEDAEKGEAVRLRHYS